MCMCVRAGVRVRVVVCVWLCMYVSQIVSRLVRTCPIIRTYLSFPTANLRIEDKYQILPKNGVYLVRGKFIGLEYYGMCNFGFRPTFDESKLIMEIHFFYDRLDNLYGEEIRVEFLDRVRDEKKFPTPDDLVLQLKKDKEYCLSLINNYN